MGGCLSTSSPSKKRSDIIDKQIAADTVRFRQECKILLLGSSESGKSTIVKQMKIIHKGGYTPTELLEFRPIIYRNVLDCAQALLSIIHTLGIDHELSEGELAAIDRNIDSYEVDPEAELDSQIPSAISRLWTDIRVKDALCEYEGDIYIMDSAPYFFDNVLRIGTPGYQPNQTDVLRARQRSVGILETRFCLRSFTGDLSIHMFDVGGQRSERKKWIHCFESVTSIIFCTALSEYDQVLLEEKSQNRMSESLNLFESVINSRWFLRTSFVLFLNKIDVFKAKISKACIPLSRYFPEYTGGPDINKAAKYILWRFMKLNRARLSVYPHLTQATDTQNIQLVFAAVKESIFNNSLRATCLI
ncbi:G protein alpha subunit [Tricholoma furcatifolium]|nr:G protein alpha subunit [Tricholoma furcatifolium]